MASVVQSEAITSKRPLCRKFDTLKEDKNELVLGILGLNRIADFNSKLCRWHSRNTQIAQTFYNQALNTLDNYAAVGMSAQYIIWIIELQRYFEQNNFEMQ